MRVYFRYISSSIQEYMAYRVSFLMELINRIGLMLIQISMWTALLAFNSLDTSAGEITLGTMITYSFLTTSIGILLTNQITGQLNGTIRSGNIALDFIRPISITNKLLAQYFGTKIIQIVIQFLPTLFVYLAFFYDKSINFYNIPYFILSLIGAIILTLLISYIVGLVAIWWTDSWPLNMFMDSIMKLLSGMWIPLWLFPDWLEKISHYLPYSSIYYGPIQILLGKTNINGVYNILLTQLVWIVGLFVIQKILWICGTNKITIQGG